MESRSRVKKIAAVTSLRQNRRIEGRKRKNEVKKEEDYMNSAVEKKKDMR